MLLKCHVRFLTFKYLLIGKISEIEHMNYVIESMHQCKWYLSCIIFLRLPIFTVLLTKPYFKIYCIFAVLQAILNNLFYTYICIWNCLHDVLLWLHHSCAQMDWIKKMQDNVAVRLCTGNINKNYHFALSISNFQSKSSENVSTEYSENRPAMY